MTNMSGQEERIQLFGEYPHSLMQHIRSLLRSENKKNDWLLSESFLKRFIEEFSEYPQEIRELQVAVEEKIIQGIWENRKNRKWEQRVFIQTSLFILVRKLREYEAVELLESLMWIFEWKYSVEVKRKWPVKEEDKARFHEFDRKNFQDPDKRMFRNTAKKHMAEREENKLKAPSEKEADVLVEKTESEESFPDEMQQSKKGGEKNIQKRESAGESGRKANQDIRPRSHDRYENSRSDGDKKTLQEKEEVIQEILETESLSEEEYRKVLQDIKIKHENLMHLSLRRDIKRAKKGNHTSQARLAEFYAEENTDHTDYLEAARWYGFAARKGNDKAKLELGKLFDSEKLFIDGNTDRLIGESVEAMQTKQYGIRYFKELAEEGYPTAQSILGMKYYFGDGVEEDKATGIRWLKKAAVQGHVEAQRQLGELYAHIDEKESQKWFRMAGSSEAPPARGHHSH